MRVRSIMLMLLTYLFTVMNISAQEVIVLENKIYDTPNGKLQVYVEDLNKGVYKYNFHIKEITKKLPQLGDWEKTTPFGGEKVIEFKKALEKVFIPLILLDYPSIGEAIKAGTMTVFWLNMCFDDRKEMIGQGFEIYGTTKDLALAQEIVKELISDDRLLKLIRKASDKVYETVPPLKREDLAEEQREALNKGENAFWGNAYVYLNKKSLSLE